VPLDVGDVVLPFGSATETVGTAVFWSVLSEPLAEVGAELSAETFRTMVGSSLATVEPSWDVITQTTGPTASSTDSALTIGPIRPRRRAVLRCRPGVGESLIGWRILFVVVPRGYRLETLTDQQARFGIAEYVLTKVRCQAVVTEVLGPTAVA
jgi:hypothetical protein